MPELGDLAINLVASVLAGTAVFVWQVLWRRRTEMRKRRFFGFADQPRCVVYVPRHASSSSEMSVHRRDTAAIVEVAAVARECRAEIELVRHEDESQRSLGDGAEFAIGGPDANPRTSAHLETFLPGLTMESYHEHGSQLPIKVGDDTFAKVPGKEEYVALAKIRTGEHAPVFVLCGQTAVTNHAAARYLSRGYRALIREFGVDESFCVVLKVVNPSAYGERNIVRILDATQAAFAAPTARPTMTR